jgi:CxxC motif-containing protein
MDELTCIACPQGCSLQIEIKEDRILISGNKCRRGEKFATSEMINPTRALSSTVRTAFPDTPVLPVRVSDEIPKSRILDVMREISRVVVTRPVARGETILRNVLNLGVDLIATSNVLQERK